MRLVIFPFLIAGLAIANPAPLTRDERLKALFAAHPDHTISSLVDRFDRTDYSRVLIGFAEAEGRTAPVSTVVVAIKAAAGPLTAGRHIVVIVDPAWLERTDLTAGERELALVYAGAWIRQLETIIAGGLPGELEHFMPYQRGALTAADVKAIFPRDLEAQLAVCRYAEEHDLLNFSGLTRTYAQGGLRALVSYAIEEATHDPEVAPLEAEFSRWGAVFLKEHLPPLASPTSPKPTPPVQPAWRSDFSPSDSRSRPRVVFLYACT